MLQINCLRTRRAFSCFVLLALAGTISTLTVYSKPSEEHSGAINFEQIDGGQYLLSVNGATVGDVAARLEEATGIKVDVDEAIAETQVHFESQTGSIEELLHSLSGSSAVIYERKDDTAEIESVRITSIQEAILPESQNTKTAVRNTVPPARNRPAWVLSNADQSASGWNSRGASYIMLQNAWIDTAEARKGNLLEVPDEWTASADTEFHIVQFDSPISADLKSALTDLGVEIQHYVPKHALAVKATREQIQNVLKLSQVTYVEAYHPYFKLSKDLVQLFTGNADEQVKSRVNKGQFNIASFSGEDLGSALAAHHFDIVRTQSSGDSTVYTVSGSIDDVREIAHVDTVRWVEPLADRKAMNDLANERVRAKSLKALLPGYTGEGVVVAVTDTGIDYKNAAFAIDPTQQTGIDLNTRIKYYDYLPSFTSDGTIGDNNGHGSHVSGTILGNGYFSQSVVASPGSGNGPYAAGKFAGIAPSAQVVMIEDFNSFTDEEQAEISWLQGARISNNSWGNSVFEYGVLCEIWDDLVRDAVSELSGDQELIAFFAAGNAGQGDDDGTGGTPSTVGQPGNAKNVITVGAVEMPRFANNLPGVDEETDSDWQVSYFSSRGPVTSTDLRVKPDIVAPGSYVLSVQSSETLPDDLLDPFLPSRDYRAGNVNSGTNFAFFSGTSMATPVAAGAAALFYQYYTNNFDAEPSPALMKAAMVSGARMLNSLIYTYPISPGQLTISDQGWGMLDLTRSVLGPRIHSSDEVIFIDQQEVTPLNTGEYYTQQIQVGANQGSLKIVLAWSDVKGTAGNGVQLVNDIDLIVQSPGGGGYLGNVFDYDGVHSYRFDVPDPIFGDAYNNVEVVTIKDPAVGTYTIQVYGWEVATGPQDYALVIQKGIGIEGRTGGDSPAIALDTNDFPVLAYSGADDAGNRQIFVKRWFGEAGDLSELGDWKRLDDQWFGLAKSASDTGVSLSLEDVYNPSVAVNSSNVYVAWENHGIGSTNIFVRQWNGKNWIELNDSAHGLGVSRSPERAASYPIIDVAGDGNPVVAWLQNQSGVSRRVFVSKWNGTTWEGFGGSETTGVFAANTASSPDMTINSSGNPVVAWHEALTGLISVREWNGVSWGDRGNVGIDIANSAKQASIDAGQGNNLFLAWKQSFASTNKSQVYAARNTGGTVWSSMAGSASYPGVSQSHASTNTPDTPIIKFTALPSPRVMVGWVSGTNSLNGVYVKQHILGGSTWTGVGGADQWPGVALNDGVSSNLAFALSSKAVPVAAFQNDATGQDEIFVYQQVLDINPPTFAGIATATGGTNNNVKLTWQPAVDNFSTQIIYRVYQGATSFYCFEIPNCSTSDVFGNLIATVTNITSYQVTGVSNYQLRCYAVRAVDAGGYDDGNTVTLYAAPHVSGIECYDLDSDSDGIPDWWEFTWFGGITNASPFATNTVGGLNNLDSYIYGTDPFNADSDYDALTDWDEVYLFNLSPSNPDTDKDGLNDGLEIDLGTDAANFDTSGNSVSDGDMYSLGFNPTDTNELFNRVLIENFEPISATRASWTKDTPNAAYPLNFWHFSTAVPVDVNTNVVLETYPSTNTSARMALDITSNNVDATYAIGNFAIIAGLVSPAVDATSLNSLFISWKEYYETEANRDYLVVQGRSGAKTNWMLLRENVSGTADGWSLNRADLSVFAGDANVQIRFLFTANNINNQFAGWYVDDVVFYEALTISSNSWVRTIDGRPLAGAAISAHGIQIVTNPVSGHRITLPGKVFAQAITAADGSYRLNGLPKGKYFVKASQSQYLTEFWNGDLLKPGGYAFGNQLNPGVFSVTNANPGGIIDLSAGGPSPSVQFELEPGDPSSYVGATADTNLPLSLNYIYNLQGWNGSTGIAAGFIPLKTEAGDDLVFNNASYDLNPVRPNFLTQVGSGTHRLGLGTNLWKIPPASLKATPGDFAFAKLSTNSGNGFMQIASIDGEARAIFLNGVDTGLDTPALVKLQAGKHLVQITTTDNQLIPAKLIDVPLGGRTNVAFTTDELNGDESATLVLATQTSGGEVITNASVYINGRLITTNSVPGLVKSTTPVTISGILSGQYPISVSKDGYKNSQTSIFTLLDDETTYVSIIMNEADIDFDRVGDGTELDSFGDILTYSGESNPDMDGLTTFQEFELKRLYGIDIDPLNADTDGDGLSDGEEVGYDGYIVISNNLMYARTELATNAVESGSFIRTKFTGRFLEGIWSFGTNGSLAVSVDGDRIESTNIVHHVPVLPSANDVETVFQGLPLLGAAQALSEGHPVETRVIGDTDPSAQDTDDDGMWDGFEGGYRYMTNGLGQVIQILDAIVVGDSELDPDADGLINRLEFLGPDNVANTNDWSDPRSADTDKDTMPDGWEYFYGLDPNDPADALLDNDEDALNNKLEFQYGTNPLLSDSDADGLPDGLEVLIYGSDPSNPDTDGDGLFDGIEVTLSTNPNNPDTDGDGMPDGFEVLDIYGNLRPPDMRLNPLDPSDADEDYDGDGLSNLEEYLVRDALTGNHPADFAQFEYTWYGNLTWFDGDGTLGWNFDYVPYANQFPVWDYSTDPFNADTDGDLIPDGYEVENGLHPVDPLIIDANVLLRYPMLGPNGDLDMDGLWNELEYRIRYVTDPSAPLSAINSGSTHPWQSDTDDDGLDDGEEHHTMHFGNPVRQDTDSDGLLDGTGVNGRWGEVDSSLQRKFDVVDCPGCTWMEAFADAQTIPSPDDPTVFGSLATIGSPREFTEVLAVLNGASGTNLALGAWAPDPEVNKYVSSYGAQAEPFLFHNFGTNPPVSVPDVTNGVVVNPNGNYSVVDVVDPVIDGYVIEWTGVPLNTNQYDSAFNDIWRLVFPSDAGLGAPVWERVVIATNSPVPPARWGHAMTYVPGYEIKDQNDDKDDTLGPGTAILLDNRKLVVIGGNSGVEKHADVWEFLIKSNTWSKSLINLADLGLISFFSPELNSGLSDLSAVLLMGYSNTKDCDPGTDVSWNNTGISFGEPKDRPWDRGYQDSSYDITYILGGWNDDHWYGLNEPLDTIYYKSTDDMVPILEESRAYDNDIRSYDVWQSTETRITDVFEDTDLGPVFIGSSTATDLSRTYADLSNNQEERLTLEDGGSNNRVPLGLYSASPTVVTNTVEGGFEVVTTLPTNIATGVRVDKFPFKFGCDRIVTADLVIVVSDAPVNDLDLYVVAEYNRSAPDNNPLSEAYFWDENEATVPTGTPEERANGKSFVSSTITFTIPAGFTGSFPIDVTTLVNEVALQSDWEGRAIGFVFVVPVEKPMGSISAININNGIWEGLGTGVNGDVEAMAFDLNENLYVGGTFTDADGVPVSNIALTDGLTWSDVGLGTDGPVLALAVDPMGQVYAGGSFDMAGSSPATNIALWSGAAWTNVGNINGTVHALASDTLGNIYAGGSFSEAGGVAAANIAMWDGATWSSLGPGVNGTVYALTLDNIGNLYVGGAFTNAGGVSVTNIAVFSGVSWASIADGIDGAVNALAYDAVNGLLFAGGSFTEAGGVSVGNIAAWDGVAWTNLAAGLNGDVNALVTDTAGGLYAGGAFTMSGGSEVVSVSYWNGVNWSKFERGFDGPVYAVAGSGLAVVAGGNFTEVPAETDSALMEENSAFIRIWHNPSYRKDATWHVGGTFQTVQGEVPSTRKSFGLSYMYPENKLIVFGGINGRTVLDETYEGVPVFGEENEDIPIDELPTDNEDVRKVRLVRWQKMDVNPRPSARWGHSQIYDDVNNRVLMFGGFDKDNTPLNDLWEYTVASVSSNEITDTEGNVISNEVVVTEGGWRKITDFQDSQRPTPRGGAMMAYVGGQFYRDDSGRYRDTGDRDKLVLFGGTDGENYFNDTWYYDDNEVNYDISTTNKSRWVLADPGGEQSPGPEPRAFGQMAMAQNGPITPDPFVNALNDSGGIDVIPAKGTFKIVDGDSVTPDGVSVYMFGGRGGTLVSGKDTDRDLVSDGFEHAVGGADAGRDPRVNALYRNLNTNETIPYAYLPIGTYGGFLPGFQRPAMADFEVLSYHERVHGWRMGYQYVGVFLPWQGYPLETTHTNQQYDVGNETIWPVDHPDTNRLVYLTGVDAMSPDWINMWYHRGNGDEQTSKDQWALGIPDPRFVASNGAPPYARSGRWVYGTGLKNQYVNDAVMELYSPIIDLTLPSKTSTQTNNNNNSFFLVFHEWLNLADANDIVRVDVVRPTTPADIYTRETGAGKLPVTIVPDRNFAYNTSGEWRRVIVPLDVLGNESNLFIRFTLQTDESGAAGGWFIDDVAIAQGYELFGTNSLAYTNINLLGVNSDMILDATLADQSGLFQFGFLPQGIYRIETSDGIIGPLEVPLIIDPLVNFEIVGLSMAVATISWEAVIGEDYQVQYTDDLLSGSWTDLPGAMITATMGVETVIDPLPVGTVRHYRVLLLNQP